MDRDAAGWRDDGVAAPTPPVAGNSSRARLRAALNLPSRLGGHVRPPLSALDGPRDPDALRGILASAGRLTPDARRSRAG